MKIHVKHLAGTGLNYIDGLGEINADVGVRALSTLSKEERTQIAKCMKNKLPIPEPTLLVLRDAVADLAFQDRYLREQRKRTSQ